MIRPLSIAGSTLSLLFLLGCASSTRFDRMAANLVGDEFRILCQSYTYHELVGAHAETIGDRRFWLYRIDLLDRHRFNGRSWTVRELRPPPSVQGGFDEARLVADSPLVLAEHYLWDERQYELRTWDTDTCRAVGPPLRIPGESSEFYTGNGYFSPAALGAFTAANRRIVVQDKAGTRAWDVAAGRNIPIAGLAGLIDRCATVSRQTREQVIPLFTEDLRFLLVVPPDLLDRNAHDTFSLGDARYSFKEYGYYGERGSPALRTFPMWEGTERLGAAESDRGRLLLLYGDNAGALVRSEDGTFEARVPAPFPLLTLCEYNRPGFIPQRIFWNTSRGELITWGVGIGVFVWDYRSGTTRLLPDPTTVRFESGN